MVDDTKKIENFTWDKLVRKGLDTIIEYWKEGEVKSKDFRLVTIVISFFKSMENELKKQTKLLQDLVKYHEHNTDAK